MGILDDEYEGPEEDEEPRHHVDASANQDAVEASLVEQKTTASPAKETTKKPVKNVVVNAPKTDQRNLSLPQKKANVKPAEQTSGTLINQATKSAAQVPL